jgi:bacterioferritin
VDKPKVIQKLNQAIALELGALLQYNQYSHVLLGPERRVWHEFFEETADEAFSHARLFAKRVVALGGVPSVEPEPVRQTNDLTEMLANSLEVERRAVQIYTEALALCEDNAAYRNLLEEQISTETEDVEELEKYLNQVTRSAATAAPAKRAGKTG